MNCAWALVTEPEVEPLGLQEAKKHLHVVTDDENNLVSSYLIAARQAAEAHLNRGLITQTWQLVVDRFYEEVALPMAAPLQSVTHIKYYDTSGVLQTLSSTIYTLDTVSRPGRVHRAVDQTWPTVQTGRVNPITITYVVGWETAEAVPERIKQGIRFRLAAYHADREGMDTQASITAAENCWDDRVFWPEPEY